VSAPELAVRCAGEGSRTLVWIHGYTMDSSVWDPLWSRLAEYRHVGIDLPRHGGSAAVPFGEVPAIAEAVLAIARRFTARDLVAISFGAIVALEAAIRAERGSLDGMVLASPALGGGPQDPESAACNLELIRMASERGLGSWIFDRWMSVPPRIFEGAARRPEVFAALRATVAGHSFRELSTGEMRSALQPLQERELGKIDAAVCVLVGEQDMPTSKRTAELIRRGIPGAQRHYVGDAGHLCLLERPDECATRISSFLRQGPNAR